MKILPFCALMVLSLLAPCRADAVLETIAPDGALASVKARKGVVFVDLFADW